MLNTRTAAFLSTTLLTICSLSSTAQTYWNRQDTVKVFENGSLMTDPWGGGFNAPQFSNIDLDQNGIDDLVVFDRTDNMVHPFINYGTAGSPEYKLEPFYRGSFPKMRNWMLLKDYNCDGKMDIFTSTSGGIKIYKNTTAGAGLNFTEVVGLLYSFQPPNDINLYVSSVDIPAIVDTDNDGDLDILTFGIIGSYVEFHRNYSVENGFGCDSLVFELRNKCWGYFSENSADNSVNINDPCPFNVSNPEMTVGEERSGGGHAGSTLLGLDMDGDGDKELVLGDVSYNNMVLVTNGGSPTSSNMVAQDPNFPSNTNSVNMSIFPAGFHVDVDQDGKRDLMVAPNSRSGATNDRSAWYYHNTGTDDSPVFVYQTNDFLQKGMIETGSGAYPVFFDYNQDGLMDLMVSNYGYFQSNGDYQSQIALYENTGTATNPQFTFITADFDNLSSVGLLQGIYPAFGDLDNDGDKDLMASDQSGALFYFENVAASGAPADFTLSQANYKDFNNDVIDVGILGTPQLFDIDGDNDLDLFMGEANGNINYYENIGSASVPSFRLINDSISDISVAEYFENIGYSVPHLYDEGGVTKMVVGSKSGYLHVYDNIDGNINGTYTLVDSMYQNIREGVQSSPAVADLNNDGLLDLVVGQFKGGLSIYMGSTTTSTAELEAPDWNFVLYPNPTDDAINLRMSGQVPSVDQISIVDALGRTWLQEKPKQSQLYTISVAELPAGIYFCTLVVGNRIQAHRFVVAH